VRALLAAALLAAAALAGPATPAAACPGWPCDLVNEVCRAAKQPPCVM
jgi:hypothetical protein